MKKKTEKRQRPDDLRPEYDLAHLQEGVRGKYASRYKAGTNLVLLSPDVAKQCSLITNPSIKPYGH